MPDKTYKIRAKSVAFSWVMSLGLGVLLLVFPNSLLTSDNTIVRMIATLSSSAGIWLILSIIFNGYRALYRTLTITADTLIIDHEQLIHFKDIKYVLLATSIGEGVPDLMYEPVTIYFSSKGGLSHMIPAIESFNIEKAEIKNVLKSIKQLNPELTVLESVYDYLDSKELNMLAVHNEAERYRAQILAESGVTSKSLLLGLVFLLPVLLFGTGVGASLLLQEITGLPLWAVQLPSMIIVRVFWEMMKKIDRIKKEGRV